MSRQIICSAMASTRPTFPRKRRSRMFTMHTVDATAVISVRETLRAAAISQHPPARKTLKPHRRIRVALRHALLTKA